MAQALFLVTSVHGAQKANFKDRLRRMVDDGNEIKIVISIFNYDKSQYVTALINELASSFQNHKQAEILQLFDIFYKQRGMKDPDKEADVDLASLNVQKKVVKNHHIEVYSDDNGLVRAELYEVLPQSGLYKLNCYKGSNVSKVIYYNEQKRPVAVTSQVNSNHWTTKFLNQNEAISCCVDQLSGGPMQQYYLSKTSIIQSPEKSVKLSKPVSNLIDDDENTGNVKYVMRDSAVSSYVISDYGNASRYSDLAAFNVSLINQYGGNSDTTVFIDLDDMINFSKYLNRNVIFNY
ncbi:hypothetical protein [Fructilactobacillus fructivorans]|uniref:Uncharacterized protein n=1 Tax=Fructilactobacillus fructivorans TaxID=1614 RepID=A0AAE6P195_9LACO|nr:hypothetical protein [Fructilactobacillus fructivorans]KRK57055.1 hypothetical protein FC73_GL001093 [Fructilactobacillus fructivorans]QFX92450.1 hypothetical protein LF543_02205 [Fructilactobacillus fructivorans]RDV65001.1 hypothetical protein DXU76_05950 [Fructilactobacillus fructivorans]